MLLNLNHIGQAESRCQESGCAFNGTATCESVPAYGNKSILRSRAGCMTFRMSPPDSSAFYLVRPNAATTCGSSRCASIACPSAVRCTPSG